MKRMFMFLLLSAMFLLIKTDVLFAQSGEIYDEGTVWFLTFVKTAPNSTDEYLRGLKNTWETSQKLAQEKGLIVSYKILSGVSSNEDDFDMILMIEYKNYASFDPTAESIAALKVVEEKTRQQFKEFDQTTANYPKIRTIIGRKYMREIFLK